MRFFIAFIISLLMSFHLSLGQNVLQNLTENCPSVSYVSQFKTKANTWNNAIWGAINALPEKGGTIFIEGEIEISEPIDLRKTKKQVCIEGSYTNVVNPGIGYNSIIVKTGDFDAIILHNYCSLRNLGVTNTCKKDKHDGIWITGYGCSLYNVGVTNQGGNGIKLGNKSYDGDYLTDCCVLFDVKCIGNTGWGVYISDEQINEANMADANANAFYSLDLRENAAGGIYINKCIDNHFYSPIIQLNGVTYKAPEQSAGIYFGSKTKGNYVYSPYCENKSGVVNEIYCAEGSVNNVVLGARADERGRGYVDDGNNVFIGHNSAIMNGLYIPRNFGFGEIKISNQDLRDGYMNLRQVEKNTLRVDSATGKGNFELSNGTLYAEGLSLGESNENKQVYYERIDDIVCKIESHVTKIKIPANSSRSKNMTSTKGIKTNSSIVATPYKPLPSGVSYYVTCPKNDVVTMTFVNSTSKEVEIPETLWRLVAIDFTILQIR